LGKCIEEDYYGFDFVDIPDFSEVIHISVFLYRYDCKDKTYFFDPEYSVINLNFKTEFHVLYIENENSTEAHFLFVSNPEKLINGKVSPHCEAQIFNMKNNSHIARDFETHVKKCKANGGKIVKKIKLDNTPMPFAPNLGNREMLNSIVNKVSYNFFKKYIVYDFETCGVTVGKSFGEKSKLLTILEPITVASAVFNSAKIESSCFSIRNSATFVNDWIQYLFEKANELLNNEPVQSPVIADDKPKIDRVVVDEDELTAKDADVSSNETPDSINFNNNEISNKFAN
jgi:hypothetical protein